MSAGAGNGGRPQLHAVPGQQEEPPGHFRLDDIGHPSGPLIGLFWCQERQGARLVLRLKPDEVALLFDAVKDWLTVDAEVVDDQ